MQADVQERWEEEDPQDHVLHMWEPLPFSTPRGYDYTRRRADKTLGTFLLRTVVVLVLSVYHYIMFGFRIKGRENLKALGDRGAVTVCNHSHTLDCTMVSMALYPRRTYTVTLESNFRIPFVRHLMRWLDGVPLAEEPHCLGEMMRAMGEAARQGSYIHIYPEAILLPYCGHIRHFKPGAFRLAAENGLPVVPMVLRQVPPRGLFRLYKRKPCLELVLLPAVECPQRGSVRQKAQALSEACFAAMDRCMKGDFA